MSVSSSSNNVSCNKIALKCCTSVLTLWERNWTFYRSPEWSVILRPVLWEKKPWCHSVAHVTQLPLAETHEWKCIFEHFLSATCSATAPAVWLAAVKEAVTMVQTVTFHAKGRPLHHGIRVQPSGCFLSLWIKLAGFFTRVPAALKAQLMHLFKMWCLTTRLRTCLHTLGLVYRWHQLNCHSGKNDTCQAKNERRCGRPCCQAIDNTQVIGNANYYFFNLLVGIFPRESKN